MSPVLKAQMKRDRAHIRLLEAADAGHEDTYLRQLSEYEDAQAQYELEQLLERRGM